MYAFALWFGLYLLIQSAGKLSLRFASIGLLTYAEGLAFMSLGAYVLCHAAVSLKKVLSSSVAVGRNVTAGEKKLVAEQ